MARIGRSGLARRGARLKNQPDFSTAPRSRRPPLWEIVAVVAAVALLGVALRTAWTTRRDLRGARDRLAAVQREVVSMRSRVQAYGGRVPVGGGLLTQAAAAGESPPERIVAQLARVLPEAARVERLSIVYGEEIALEMRVVARDAIAWDLTLERLEEMRFLEEVSPGPEHRDGEVRTTVSARWVERSR